VLSLLFASLRLPERVEKTPAELASAAAGG
jgi:hypothetical protein